MDYLVVDDPQEEEDFPGRLLHQAALWDNAELLEDLLRGDQLAYINSQDAWGRTPLHAAATTENSECLRVLLQSGANPNIACGTRGEGKTPLHVCAEYGFVNNVRLLLSYKAALIAKDVAGLTAYDIAEKGDHAECAQLLKETAVVWEQSRGTAHVALRDAVLMGDVQLLKSLIAELGTEAEAILNMAPNGSNTLLFVACEMGNKEIVKLLMDYEADGRIHPVTRYSPLYISCFKGWIPVVEILLKKFPELVQQPTVENWLPIHAACINGHVHVMEILLKYSYPRHMYTTYRIGDWEYELPFDVNMRDVTGQNILYMAALLGHYKMANAIIKYKVRANRIKSGSEDDGDNVSTDSKELASPTRRRISDGIQSIMCRLNLGSTNSAGSNDVNERLVSPWNIDDYCNQHSETALHVAVRKKQVEIASLLLTAGANPNLSIYPMDSCANTNTNVNTRLANRGETTTALVIACQNRDLTMVELLLKHNARDDDGKALSVAIKHGDDVLITKLLIIKAYADPEHKINKKAMNEKIPSNFGSITNFTYSNMFANTPVMVNWHNAHHCYLPCVKPQWLIEAGLHINPKLKLNPMSQQIALFAITRLDISINSLCGIPPLIFQLQSLRYLNLAQNKIEKLPTSVDFEEETSPSNKRRSRSSIEREKGYCAPLLEELYLQDNRLEKIPEDVFRLPSLTTLDVSNNKLQELPFQMWRSPKLKELNAAFNLLKELPAPPVEDLNSSRRSICSVDSNQSTESGCEAFPNAVTETSCKWRTIQLLNLEHHNEWSDSLVISEQILHAEESESSDENCSQLSTLNLAHNQFTAIPVVLSCLAVKLTRLNMAYNSLRSMSYITSYPSSLKQLDLSHNKICVWPSLPQVHDENLDSIEQAFVSCYHHETGFRVYLNKLLSGRRQTLRSSVLNSVCTHRRHLRLENLRTLVLADNCVTRIQFSTDDDGVFILHDSRDDLDHWEGSNTSNVRKLATKSVSVKTRLMFPNLSMLDLSNNQLKEIPSNIHELNSLSVLNISGNPDVTELPPQMGLLSRMWNLNTKGCNLQEPLRSMIDSNKYKTMDVIGFLKSILEDARPYARLKLMIVGVQGIGKTSLLEQLRQEGTGSYKKKPVEHWAKRMGNKNINVKTAKGTNISTVGVDIGDWVYEKKVRNQSSHGPVIFRTWDFGGQREYYATHQYFLSKRSLYLVVWRIPDGQKGVSEIFHWLVNIQARAPNSPVLIVGTHYDQMKEHYPASRSEDLQQFIRDKFVNIVDAEKCGLPRILDTIEVSCKTRHNIRLLCNLIYDTVFSLRLPGSKELLLEQKVPATYLALEDVICHIATVRRQKGLDPVLTAQEYKSVVSEAMQSKCQRTFRDLAELHQATLFLHDNGVLLHYDDATLKDLYFLDPQWLCDMLAHVVTIREINPFARTGIMKLDDLKHVFKSSTLNLTDAQNYIVNLLNKFEVALTWDNRTLLIPSLLSSEEEMLHTRTTSIRIPLRTRTWASRVKKQSSGPPAATFAGGSAVDAACVSNSTNLVAEITNRCDPEASVRRLLIMTYFPSGFWSRLITRILADDSIVEIVRSFFILPKEVLQNSQLLKLLDVKVEWVLWQTGMELRYADIVIFRIKEILQNIRTVPINYREQRLMVKQENVWTDVELKNASLLEILLPLDNIVIKRPVVQEDETIGYQAVVLDPSPEYSTQLLALAVDHIDVLLEDWYPTLGTRFIHTSEGKFLITRLVPCPRCVTNSLETDCSFYSQTNDTDDSKLLTNWQCLTNKIVDQQPATGEFEERIHRVRKSQESYTSDGDSGVGGESPASSCKTSVEGYSEAKCRVIDDGKRSAGYSWLVEECILASYDRKCVVCPTHGDISLAQVAPDTIFLDLGEKFLVRPQNLIRGKLLGRGAFGFVFKGTYKVRGTNKIINVAMKMLQPVQPGSSASGSAMMAYKGAQNKWDRDPLQYACKAYCTARQELNILLNLQHINIVPLIGMCTKPLALVLDLAPGGALNQLLKHYRRSGAKFDTLTLQAIILQAAKALEYLHQQRIIYRDLKSENVLVWYIAPPFTILRDELPKVHIKLADYGISRLTLPSGTKGFGGTEGFMAPEIMRYNGEEEYTEKVDCFSFGMFIYELLTLHQPFENHESVKECILEGGRPSFTRKETQYPSYMLDLMVICWAQSPSDRPSASQIVSIASAPEFTHLQDVISLDHAARIISSLAVPLYQVLPADNYECSNENDSSGEVWLGCSNSRVDQLLNNDKNWLQYSSLNLPKCPTALALVNESYVWVGDDHGQIHAYSIIDCSHIFSYALAMDTSDIGSVCKLANLSHMNRVAVALTNGRIFLVRSDILPSSHTMAEGSFVLTELGSSDILYTLTVLYRADESGTPNAVCELWCGESNGNISIFTMQENSVVDHDTINHFETPMPNVNVLQLVSSHLPVQYQSRHPAVWSYIHPGCVVYEWEPQSRTILNKLDCSKLAPCSESIKSISIEEHLSPGRCQVTSICVMENEIYIGTTWGCIVVAERESMRPITVFRPYNEEVFAILTLSVKQDGRMCLATVGRGYRSLIARYKPGVAPKESSTLNNTITILWSTGHWAV